MFRFNPSYKFRVVVDRVCFYATAQQIRDGVGDFPRCNEALQNALISLEKIRSGAGAADQCANGIGGTWNDFIVQLDA